MASEPCGGSSRPSWRSWHSAVVCASCRASARSWSARSWSRCGARSRSTSGGWRPPAAAWWPSWARSCARCCAATATCIPTGRDGGATVREMAEAARELGREYVVLSDHSPSLTIANGLSPSRLEQQLDEVAQLNRGAGAVPDPDRDRGRHPAGRLARPGSRAAVAPGRGGRQHPLRAADVRAADDAADGHRPGGPAPRRAGPLHGADGDRQAPPAAVRLRSPRSSSPRPLRFDKAIEINARPERLDPPKRLLRLAVEAGCRFSIDSDAHYPGQLAWLPYGCDRAAACGVHASSRVNTMGPMS